MTRQKKEQPPQKKTQPTPNAAKARRTQRTRTQRAQNIREFDTKNLEKVLKSFGEGLKAKIQERQQIEIATRFGAPTEDLAAQSFAIPAPLTKPNHHVEHGDRIQWFWRIEDFTVVASLIMKDSAYLDSEPDRHGNHTGDWVVDVIGPGGSACFQMTPDTAKAVGEATLSAVYWKFAWRDYTEISKPAPGGKGTLSAKVVPIYVKDD